MADLLRTLGRGRLVAADRLHGVGRAGAGRSRARRDGGLRLVPRVRAPDALGEEGRGRRAAHRRHDRGPGPRARRPEHERSWSAGSVTWRPVRRGRGDASRAVAADAHETGGRRQARDVEAGLPARRDPHPRHVDAPRRHLTGDGPRDGAHLRPRRPPRRRCRGRVGPPARSAVHPGAGGPGGRHLHARRRRRGASPSTPSSSAGSSPGAPTARACSPRRCRSDGDQESTRSPTGSTASRPSCPTSAPPGSRSTSS